MTTAPQRLKQIKHQHRVQLFAFLGIIFFIFYMLMWVDNMLLSTVLAFVLFYSFGPFVNAFERRGLNRVLGISLLFAVSSLFFIFAVTSIYPLVSSQASALKSEIPKYINGTTDLILKTESQLAIFSELFQDINIIGQTEKYLYNWTQSLFEDLPNFLSHSLTVTLLAPFFAFFMLKDGPALSRRLFNMVPNNLFELSINLKHQINSQLGSFIRARLLESVLVGALVWVGLWLIGFKFATVLAIFAALANLIPYIGPIVGAAPALIIALINGEGPMGVTLVLTPYLIAQIIDIFFIIPLVVAKIVNLHPVTIIISFIIGADLLGVLGMVIAIPAASVIKVTIANVYEHLVEFRS